MKSYNKPCKFCDAEDWDTWVCYNGKGCGTYDTCKNCGATYREGWWDRETIPQFRWGWMKNVKWVKGIKKQVLG